MHRHQHHTAPSSPSPPCGQTATGCAFFRTRRTDNIRQRLGTLWCRSTRASNEAGYGLMRHGMEDALSGWRRGAFGWRIFREDAQSRGGTSRSHGTLTACLCMRSILQGCGSKEASFTHLFNEHAQHTRSSTVSSQVLVLAPIG